MDHKGILHEFAEVLAGIGVNIRDIETSVTPAPLSGAPLFSAKATVLLPSSVGTGSVRAELKRIAGDHCVGRDS